MKSKIQSHSLKALLGLLVFISLIIMFFALPHVSEIVANDWKEIEYLRLPILIICQIMMALFITGLVIIIYLLVKFDKREVFTFQFTNGLKLISLLCIFAVVGLFIIFFLLGIEGGPGPGLAILIIALSLVLIILGNALSLFAQVINQAITYKQENELTV